MPRQPAPPPPVPAYSYLRFSKPEQARGDSVRRQTALAAAWCSRNGAALDHALTMRDQGVSAYSGANRSDKAALGAFLALARSGRVARGSYLLVESLDRLSREEAVPALSLLLELIQAGVRVVQLLPAEVVYDERANPMALMLAVAELSRGHAESKMKSERCGRAWAEKKRLAAATKRPITRTVPAWVEVGGDGRFALVPDRAAAVRHAFDLALAGYGVEPIAARMEADGFPPFRGVRGANRGRYWSHAYVAQILKGRAAVGEYQPMRGKSGRRVPDGPPIPGYFPAAVPEDVFLATRAAVLARKPGRKPGPAAAPLVNVFQGLLIDARTGTRMHVSTARSAGGPVLYPAAYTRKASPFASFPLAPFEAGVFALLAEVDPAAVLPRPGRGPDPAAAVAARRADLAARVERVKARMAAAGEGDVDALADVLARLGAEVREADARLAALRAAAPGPLADAWGRGKTLAAALAAAPDPADARVRLRAALREVVAGAWCLVVPRGEARLCAAQFAFAGSSHRREFLVWHRPARSVRGKRLRDSEFRVRSLARPPGLRRRLDLADPAHAAAVERHLAAVPLADLVGG